MRCEDTLVFWQRWSARCTYSGKRRDVVVRSLLTLKAMTFAETGAIVAAPTTSLPEQLGGSRNWDYRYCWVRDATLTLTALMGGGYYEEAGAWRDWLHRAVAGTPEDLQIMYGIFGERRLAEWEVPWLPGYQGAAPVRIGNAASGQLQLDVWGEMMDALHLAREGGLAPPNPLGTCNVRPWSIWRGSGRIRMMASGRYGVRGSTLPIPRSWRGWRLTAPSRMPRNIRLKAPLDQWQHIRDEIHQHGIGSRLPPHAAGLYTKFRLRGAGCEFVAGVACGFPAH